MGGSGWLWAKTSIQNYNTTAVVQQAIRNRGLCGKKERRPLKGRLLMFQWRERYFKVQYYAGRRKANIKIPAAQRTMTQMIIIAIAGLLAGELGVVLGARTVNVPFCPLRSTV